jgi:hypothetical protein
VVKFPLSWGTGGGWGSWGMGGGKPRQPCQAKPSQPSQAKTSLGQSQGQGQVKLSQAKSSPTKSSPRDCLGRLFSFKMQEVPKNHFCHELGRRRSSGRETTAVLHGISTRIQWDQFWTSSET